MKSFCTSTTRSTSRGPGLILAPWAWTREAIDTATAPATVCLRNSRRPIMVWSSLSRALYEASPWGRPGWAALGREYSPVPGAGKTLPVGLDDDRGPVGEHLGHPRPALVGVVAQGPDRVGPDPGRVLQHQVEGLLPRPLAQLGVQRDVAPEEGLDGRAQVHDQVAGAHGDAAHHPAIAHDALALEPEAGRHPLRMDRHGRSLSARQSTTATPSISIRQASSKSPLTSTRVWPGCSRPKY